ncbi:MAG: AAA family ATPase [Anaerolineae bacterium]|nr:AAA family ATPase [Anaerolineae bacterium]
MRVAVSGKGGSGKTTIAGLLARTLARTGRRVLAIDADPNPNLSIVLGLPRDHAFDLQPIPRDMAGGDGTRAAAPTSISTSPSLKSSAATASPPPTTSRSW